MTKAQYLIGLYAEIDDAQHPRRKVLVANVLDELQCLSDKAKEKS